MLKETFYLNHSQFTLFGLGLIRNIKDNIKDILCQKMHILENRFLDKIKDCFSLQVSARKATKMSVSVLE